MLARGNVLLLFVSVIQFTLTSGQGFWWISDYEVAFEEYDGGVSVYNALTRNKTTDDIIQSLVNSTLSYSRDLHYIAEYINKSVKIYESSTNISYPVGKTSQEEANITAFKWSHGSAYAYKIDDEVYYTPAPGEAPIKIADQVDSRNTRGADYSPYGYDIKEEWYVGISFSPSDKYLAYSNRTNDLAKQVQMTSYRKGEAYDHNFNYTYIMTGDTEHFDFSIFIWSVEERKSAQIEFQIRENSSSYYYLNHFWVVLHGKELLFVSWANRWYNETTLYLCSYENASCSQIYKHKYEHAQWMEYEEYQNIVYSNSAIFLILPRARSDNAWNHIAKIEISTDYQFESLSFLPAGDYDIRRIIAYRPIEDVVIYDAQAPHPWNRHVYATPLTGSLLKEDHCITCQFPNCTFQKCASVSEGRNMHIAFLCNGPSQFNITMISYNGTLHPQEIHNIAEPTDDILKPNSKMEIFNLSSGYEAIVRIYEGDTNLSSVPVTLFVYGGPDDNQATDEAKQWKLTTFANGAKGAIVFIDVRGSGGRGWKYRSAIYKGLVTVEVEDTIEAMKMVLDKYPRLDKNRVGVAGWSYGGTMTTALVESAPKSFFKCAIAVAPVTNFLHYYALYTERYMGDAPPSAYTDLTRNVTAFRHTKLLLVHGLKDGTVLFHHSALLIEALQREDIPFQLMVYPNGGHDLQDVRDHRNHLFESFLSPCYE